MEALLCRSELSGWILNENLHIYNPKDSVGFILKGSNVTFGGLQYSCIESLPEITRSRADTSLSSFPL
jgi:hypothetical protein